MMMTEHEIRETFDLEWQLAKILLKKRHWIHQFTTLDISTQAKYNKATKTGIIRIAQERYGERDYKQLRQDIRELFADLCSGFQPRHKYLWQIIAKDLNLIQDITAQDMCECTLCNNYTKLTHHKLCAPCYWVNKVVREHPSIARKVLAQMEKGK